MDAPAPIERLITQLKKLPGVGEKSAGRLAFHLLAASDEQVQQLAQAIQRVKTEIIRCARCFDLSDASPCRLCSDPKRDPQLLCVVEEPADRAAVEQSGDWRGQYHILGGALAPIDGVGPEQLRIAELEARVREQQVREVLLATNPNAAGDATAHYLAERLRAPGLLVTRIGYGMPIGGDLEYADQLTIGRALQNRRALD